MTRISSNRNWFPMGYGDYGSYNLRLIRSWRLHQDSVPIYVATRQQRLIAALAILGPSLRGYLAGLLWPESPNPKALESLRVSVHLVSRQVPGLIMAGGATLSLGDRVDVDLHRVKAQIGALREGSFIGNATSSIAEFRGAELLPGWYEDWVLLEQERLRQDMLHAFAAISQQLLDQGDFEVAGAAAVAALDIEPLYETAARLLVAAEFHNGNPAAAVRSYERYRTRLEEEMGLQPSDSFKMLVQQAIGRRLRVS